MKKIALLFVGVLAGSLTFANPKITSGMAVLKRDESSFKVIYKSELESDVKVQIFDQNNVLVFTEKIKNSNGFVRPYNFDGLNEGEYTIRLDNGSNWMTETVKYSGGKTEKLAQLIQLNDGKYLLTVAGVGEDLLTVKVSKGTGELIHFESTPVYGDFAQVYDLGKIKRNFTFEVTDNTGATKILKK